MLVVGMIVTGVGYVLFRSNPKDKNGIGLGMLFLGIIMMAGGLV